MKRISFFILFMGVFYFDGFCQLNDWEKTIFVQATTNSVSSIHVNIEGVNHELIGRLKDDLVAFDQKVESVVWKKDIDELIITYNEYMQLQDLIEIFYRNDVEYMKYPQRKSIN